MTTDIEQFGRNHWQSPEYVDSWFADRVRQADYREPRQRMVFLLPFDSRAAIRVLDVGAGDGALSLQILDVYPKAQLVCHDFSDAMLARARQRLAPFSAQVAFVKSDLKEPAWISDIEGKFDGVVSSIAIHNVAERSQGAAGRIREIYAEIFKLVKPGGCFFNFDYVTSPGPTLEAIYLRERRRAYQAKVAAEGIEKSPQELDQEFQQIVARGAPGVRPILCQLEWLRQAGFDEVDCLWKDTHRAVFGGFRH